MPINGINDLLNLDHLVAGLDTSDEQPFFIETDTIEAAGVFHSSWRMRTAPGRKAVPTSGINGANRTGGGAIPFTNPSAGQKYLAAFQVVSSQPGTLLLCDRLWDNSGLNVTTTGGQAITQPTLPARDLDGATAGRGIWPAIEVSTATTNAGAVTNATITINPVGADTSEILSIRSFPATAVQNVFSIPGAATTSTDAQRGLTGISTVTLGTSLGAGAIHTVAYRVIAAAGITQASVGVNLDAFDLNFPQIYNDSCLFLLWLPANTTAATIAGKLTFAEGTISNGFKAPGFFYGWMTTGQIGWPHSTWRAQQLPNHGTTAAFPGSLAGAVVTAGPVDYQNPVAPAVGYLTQLGLAVSSQGSGTFVDRLWHSSALATTNGAQTVNSVTLPARDANGATSGLGVMAAVHLQTAMGASIAGATITYTNSDGVGSRTGKILTATATWVGAAAAVCPFALQEGDRGVQSIQSFNWNGTVTSGTAYLMMYRRLGRIDCPTTYGMVLRNFAELGMPRLYDNSAIELWFETDTAATVEFYGIVGWAHK